MNHVKLRELLSACLLLLCLNSRAQTVVESMELFDEGKTSEAVTQLNKLGQSGNADAQKSDLKSDCVGSFFSELI